ncbi:MAG TPA: HPr kinase/phosphorylase, partial [Rhodanobacteraceae bacterium]|nr:HPr kinase/phosphorylase [Rhodanobacteraceae bacterium]
MNRVSARDLFEDIKERMALRWVAGRGGAQRALQSGGDGQRRPSEIGYLNIIYPNKLQIVGSEELNYLDGLDSRQRWETVQKIFAQQPVALIVTKDQAIPADLRDAADETGTPLWVSARRGHDVLTFLQYKLARALAPQITLHGVFMEVHSIGVLITGTPGSGKSELALELIT